MTVTTGLSITAPKASVRAVERGNKDAAEGGQRFDEALAARKDRAAGPGTEMPRNRPVVEPVGFGPIPDENHTADPQALVEIPDEAGIADLPVTEIEAVLLVLQVLSGADAPRPQATATAMAAGNDDAPMQGIPTAETGDAPARDGRPGDRNVPSQPPLPVARDALLPPDPRPGERNAGLLRPASLGEAAARPLREAGIRYAAGSPAAASLAASRTSLQARAGDAQAAPLSAQMRPAEPTVSELQPAGEPARSSPKPAAFDSGNRTGMASQTTTRMDPIEAIAGRLNILGHSTTLPPAPPVAPLTTPTVAGLVSAMDADPSWRAAAAEMNAPAGQRAPGLSGPVSTLRIQLNPAELGMVTARLTTTGSQLSIEIQTESNDARQRLAADSETIARALRAIGYDVDKVTIQQAPQGGNPSQGQAAGRDPFTANQQQGEAGARGQDRGGGDADRQQGARNGGGEAAADRAGGGLYI